MKDSNAVPSSNSSAFNANRGEVAAPKANAEVASQVIARAESGNADAVVAPVRAQVQANVPVAVAPEVAKVEVVKAKERKPEIPFPEMLAPKAAPAKVADKSETEMPKTTAAKITTAKATSNKPVAPVAPISKVSVPKTAKPRPAAAPVASTPSVNRQRVVPKFRPLYIFGALTALILTTAGGVAVGSYSNWNSSQQIAPNVRVAGEPIGGLTRQQAASRLKKRFGKLAFTLKTDDKATVLGLASIGGKPSVEPTVEKAFAVGRGGSALDNFTRVFGSEAKARTFMLPIEWNRGALTSQLKIVNNQYAQPAVDARLVTVNGATPRVTEESTGRALDISATANAIQKSYYLGVPAIPAVTRSVEPKVVATDLAGRDMKLGEYRTNYNGGIAGRTTNIHVACRAIDGQVLMPGEVLSFNGSTGERTYRKGYRMAHIFLREKGQTESSVVDGLAGGVCQVSSTLYNAVRKTNAQSVGKPLRIVERTSHSLPVTYVPPGRDATVAWPSKDFKFRNDQDFPIYVRTKAGNGNLVISIWGRVPDSQALPVSLNN